MSRENICFLSNPFCIEEATNWCRNNSFPLPDMFYTSEVETIQEMNRLSLSCVNLEKFLKKKDFENIHKVSLEYSRNWFKKKEYADIVSFDGINFGIVFSLEMYYSMTNILTTLAMVNNFIEQVRPMSFTIFLPEKTTTLNEKSSSCLFSLDDFLLEKVLEVACAQKEIPLKVLNVLQIEKKSNMNSSSFLADIKNGINKYWNVDLAVFLTKIYNRIIPLSISKSFNGLKIRKGVDFVYIGSDFYDKELIRKIKCLGYRIVVSPNVDKTFLSLSGVPVLYIDSSLCDNEPDCSKEWKHYFEEHTDVLSEKLEVCSPVNFMNVELGEIIGPKIKAVLRKTPDVIKKYIVSKYILKKRAVKGLFTMADGEINLTPSILAARKLGIPTANLQHGFNEFNNTGHIPTNTDYQFVLGEAARKFYIKEGTSPQSVISEGISRFDFITKSQVKDIKRIKSKMGLNPDKRVILYLLPNTIYKEHRYANANMTYTECLESIHTTIRALVPATDFQVLVRYHPLATKDPVLKSFLKENLPSFFISKQHSYHDTLATADIIVANHVCTSILEAILMDKPIIFLDTVDRFPKSSFQKEDAVLTISDPVQLMPIIKEIDEGKWQDLSIKRKHYIEKNTANYNGYATQNIAKTLISIFTDKQNDGGPSE